MLVLAHMMLSCHVTVILCVILNQVGVDVGSMRMMRDLNLNQFQMMVMRSKKTFHTVWQKSSHVRERKRKWSTFATIFRVKATKHSVSLKLTLSFWNFIHMIIVDPVKEGIGVLVNKSNLSIAFIEMKITFNDALEWRLW